MSIKLCWSRLPTTQFRTAGAIGTASGLPRMLTLSVLNILQQQLQQLQMYQGSVFTLSAVHIGNQELVDQSFQHLLDLRQLCLVQPGKLGSRTEFRRHTTQEIRLFSSTIQFKNFQSCRVFGGARRSLVEPLSLHLKWLFIVKRKDTFLELANDACSIFHSTFPAESRISFHELSALGSIRSLAIEKNTKEVNWQLKSYLRN